MSRRKVPAFDGVGTPRLTGKITHALQIREQQRASANEGKAESDRPQFFGEHVRSLYLDRQNNTFSDMDKGD